MKPLNLLVPLAALLLLAAPPAASSLTITASFAGGTPPANASGGGDVLEVVKAAARIWEAAYSDPIELRLYVGWAPVGDAGTHTLVEQGGDPNRETTGIILFDNSGAVPFFLDPTPAMNEEYRRRTEEYQDLGAGFINVARVFGNPAGEAAGRVDLLTVALHEIGHALGMCITNPAFIQQSREGVLRIGGGLPYAGTAIPLASNNSGVTSHFDPVQVIYGSLMGGISGDERRLPSELDILANAQISMLSLQTLDPRQEPDPSSGGERGAARAGSSEPVTRRTGK